MVVFQVRGLLPALFTPLKGQCLNVDIIPAYAQYLAKHGVKAALVGGTNGESTSLRVSDRKKLIESWVEAGKSEGLHIMVQIGGAAFPDVINLAKHSALVGANSLLVLPELYFRPQSVSELVSYVSKVSEAAPNLPLLYYHFPFMSKVEMNMAEFVLEASKHVPNFKGIKFSGNDLTQVIQVLRNLQDDQEVFLGCERLIAAASLLGIRSFIGGSINLFPTLAQDILTAVENNDISTARALQEKLTLAVDAITENAARIPAMKTAMGIVNGLTMGPPLLPQEPLSDAVQNKIKLKLKNLGMI